MTLCGRRVTLAWKPCRATSGATTQSLCAHAIPKVAVRLSSLLERQQIRKQNVPRTCWARRRLPHPAAHDGLGGPQAGPHAQHPAHPDAQGRRCDRRIAHRVVGFSMCLIQLRMMDSVGTEPSRALSIVPIQPAKAATAAGA